MGRDALILIDEIVDNMAQNYYEGSFGFRWHRTGWVQLPDEKKQKWRQKVLDNWRDI